MTMNENRELNWNCVSCQYEDHGVVSEWKWADEAGNVSSNVFYMLKHDNSFVIWLSISLLTTIKSQSICT